MRTRKLFIACFAIVIILISWRDIADCKELPWPPRFVATAIVFGLLDLASGLLGEVAPLVAVGIVVAALVNNTFATPDCFARLAYSTEQPASYQNLQQGPSSGTVAT